MKSIRLIFTFALLATITFLFNGCLDSEEPYNAYAQLQKDLATIDEYLDDNLIVAIEDKRGIRMDIETLGTGLSALQTNKVKVNYVGRVLGSASPFDQGVVTGRALNQYIDGWKIAMSTLPVGTTATIYIPSPLGYGKEASAEIPANSILVFDIEFQDIEETELEKEKFTSDTTAIDAYLAEKDFVDAITDPSGIRYRITQEGSGPTPTWFHAIKAKLVYKLLTNDGNVAFTQNLEPSDLYNSWVGNQIPGLQAGLQKMKLGGKTTFYVPSGLAYGPTAVTDSGATIFPPNANLIIEVELTDIL
jgi:FKBP-type peptidyl-prolyl cis-trans isomerase